MPLISGVPDAFVALAPLGLMVLYFVGCMLTIANYSGYVRFNLTAQAAIAPNLITLAAVLDAVPLVDSQLAALFPDAPLRRPP